MYFLCLYNNYSVSLTCWYICVEHDAELIQLDFCKQKYFWVILGVDFIRKVATKNNSINFQSEIFNEILGQFWLTL